MSVTVLVDFQRVTERAILVHYENTPVWLPKSQIENWGANQDHVAAVRGSEITLVLSDWIAREKNITSNTTADDSPINEEKFQVVAFERTINGEYSSTAHRVEAEGRVWCTCEDSQTAMMIAAALTLTEGKV
jgi:hypothetical protein